MYGKITISSRYSPWLGEDFMKLINIIRSYSLVDIYRCYELWDLAGQVKDKEGALIEVGVWNGGTAALLVSQANGAPVYLCDTFTGVVKASSKDSQYKGGEHSDCSIENVKRVVGFVGGGDVQILRGIFPEETAMNIDVNEKFKFMHLDVDVYRSTHDAIAWIWPRMIRGGIVVVDDYGAEQCDGVTKAITEIVRPSMIKLYNLNGHAVLIKV